MDQAKIEERARALQSSGPDEFPWGFYLYVAEQQLREEARS